MTVKEESTVNGNIVNEVEDLNNQTHNETPKNDTVIEGAKPSYYLIPCTDLNYVGIRSYDPPSFELQRLKNATGPPNFFRSKLPTDVLNDILVYKDVKTTSFPLPKRYPGLIKLIPKPKVPVKPKSRKTSESTKTKSDKSTSETKSSRKKQTKAQRSKKNYTTKKVAIKSNPETDSRVKFSRKNHPSKTLSRKRIEPRKLSSKKKYQTTTFTESPRGERNMETKSVENEICNIYTDVNMEYDEIILPRRFRLAQRRMLNAQKGNEIVVHNTTKLSEETNKVAET
ncbi:hypothetical protein RF11_06592 [Thelohanellus kitauei]|uniref:Uncharacterized protein n=1 Tax=Thelohanellus kitauei TaxID=669202 RepID=A0A0C2MYJ3_THEKT|nr:hypothetical protein RF11_06592 [Thelohanellus kitauei]